jgi:hypothetical protein
MNESRHRWGDPVTVLAATPSGCEETRRVCAFCKLQKITVHPPQGFPWREWCTVAGMRAKLDATPPCLPAPAAVPLR